MIMGFFLIYKEFLESVYILLCIVSAIKNSSFARLIAVKRDSSVPTIVTWLRMWR